MSDPIARLLLTEIRTTARLQHPHILPPLDGGNHTNGEVTPDGRYVLAEPEQRGRLGSILNWAPPEGVTP
ncbi:MAG: hypothetical protein AB7R55_20175 [Gemmatimonadales bacterium]